MESENSAGGRPAGRSANAWDSGKTFRAGSHGTALPLTQVSRKTRIAPIISEQVRCHARLFAAAMLD
jgi:hypothetical protein